MLCKAMNFGVLPVAGGLYDQHPQLIHDWELIMEAEGREEERKQRERERKSAHSKSATMGSGRRSNRR